MFTDHSDLVYPDIKLSSAADIVNAKEEAGIGKKSKVRFSRKMK